MKSFLEAIKQHKALFIATISYRQETSFGNKELHQEMKEYIEHNDWMQVLTMLENPFYRKPMDGVVWCLNKYNDLTPDEHTKIVELWEKHYD